MCVGSNGTVILCLLIMDSVFSSSLNNVELISELKKFRIRPIYINSLHQRPHYFLAEVANASADFLKVRHNRIVIVMGNSLSTHAKFRFYGRKNCP